MATLMLPAEAEKSMSAAGEDARPRLTLRDYTPIVTPARKRPRARYQNKGKNWGENLLLAAALAATLLFCLIGLAQSLYPAAVSDPPASAYTAVVPVTVHPGDTLWTYAQKYGAPDSYILDRVEVIAHVNHLSSDAALVVGQHLLVPVTNPVLLARLESRRRLARR